MSTKNRALALLEKKVAKLGLRREVENEIAQILIEHKTATLRKRRAFKLKKRPSSKRAITARGRG